MKTSFKDPLFQGSLLLALVLACLATYYFIRSIKAENADIQTTQGMFEIHHWTSPEGTKVVFAPLPELPIVDIHVVFAAGSAYDGEKFGRAQLVQQLMAQDTREMTGDEIHEAFESVGALFDVGVGQDGMDMSLRSLTDPEYFKPALKTFKEILAHTSFTQPVFDREKQSLLTAINSDKQNPRAVISDAYYQALYGSHPYAHPVEGTAESISALTLQDVQAFHSQHLVKENAIIAIAGDLSLTQAKKIAEQLIEAMPSGEAAPAIAALAQMSPSAQSVKFPSSQTHLMMGLPALAKGNPDFFALSVGNQILGVTPLVNRLFQKVREQEGLVYNISSNLITLKQPGPFTIYLQSRAEEASKAENLVQELLKNYLENGPTEAELQAAKDNLSGQFALGLSNNAAISAHIATLAFYQLPMDYQDHYQENINAVTLDEVKNVFNRYIVPEKFTLIRLGEMP